MNKEELASLSRYIRIEIESIIIPITIDLSTHKVIDWKNEYGSKSIFEKVVDTGIYILLDENKQEIYRIEGYVPNEFLPEKDGYGDYLTLNIAQDGTVTNWYDEPDFQEFIEQGYSPLSVTSEENIQLVINTFLLPLSKSIDDKLIHYVKNGFYDCGTSPQLSLMPNETHKCLELSQNEDTNKHNPEYSRYLRETKSMWLDFYARCPLYSNQSLRYANIWTDIELHKDHIRVKALHKDYPYTQLPSLHEIEEISDLFQQTLLQMIHGKIENKKYLGE